MAGTRSGRQLICLISAHRKTEDEIVEEAMRAWEDWKVREAAQAEAEVEQRHETPDGGTTTE